VSICSSYLGTPCIPLEWKKTEGALGLLQRHYLQLVYRWLCSEQRSSLEAPLWLRMLVSGRHCCRHLLRCGSPRRCRSGLCHLCLSRVSVVGALRGETLSFGGSAYHSYHRACPSTSNEHANVLLRRPHADPTDLFISHSNTISWDILISLKNTLLPRYSYYVLITKSNFWYFINIYFYSLFTYLKKYLKYLLKISKFK